MPVVLQMTPKLVNMFGHNLTFSLEGLWTLLRLGSGQWPRSVAVHAVNQI